MMGTMRDDDPFRIAADARHRNHDGNHGVYGRPAILHDNELVGLRGEQALATFFDCDMGAALASTGARGDGGFDLELPFLDQDGDFAYYRVDVKTSPNPKNLIVEVGRVKSRTIYVLARLVGLDRPATLLGWEWSANVRRSPSRDFGHGIVNHHIGAGELRDIDILRERYVRPPTIH
jgi:hypothetical protein